MALLRSAPRQFGLSSATTFSRSHGVDIVRQVRSFLPRIPIVIISGMGDLEPEYEGLNVIVRQSRFHLPTSSHWSVANSLPPEGLRVTSRLPDRLKLDRGFVLLSSPAAGGI